MEQRADGTVVAGPFNAAAERRSVLDRAHRGDIVGAFGAVELFDTGPRRSLARRLGTLAAIMGPGVIVMVGDNEAGSLSVYGQAGNDYGLSLLWIVALLVPVLFINQEMVARLGAITGAGHARLIYERFGRRWGAFALTDLLALTLLTIVTEFIGIALAASYLGLSRYVAVPIAAAALIGLTGAGSFPRWERAMYALVAVNVLVIPLFLLSHPHPLAIGRGFVPGLSGTFTDATVLLALALAGATVTPWQLFFQQSNVVDKRITTRWLAYERLDTLLGTLLFALGAVAVIATCAFALHGWGHPGSFLDAGSIARGLGARLGSAAGLLFALVLLNGSILGALVVTLGTSYALGDVLGLKHSLHRRWSDAPGFYGSYGLMVALAAAVVLLPGAPLGYVTTVVQALAGVLLPSALVFLLLLCNDREVLGPWTNPPWLNAIAAASIAVLLVLSGLLGFATLMPSQAAEAVVVVLALLAAVGGGVLTTRRPWRGGRQAPPPLPRRERQSWTMPPLETLAPPHPSLTRTVGLVALRAYLVVTVALLVVRAARAIVGT